MNNSRKQTVTPSGEGKRSILLVAGEASGDRHTAALAAALLRLDPRLHLWGAGGDAMRAAGVDVVYDLASLGVVGLSEVLAHYREIRRIFHGLLREVDRRRPDLVVLTDYPGFNIRFAQAVRRRGCRVAYHISPQVWAWGRKRIPKLARLAERMLVIFPFEVDVYAGAGLDTRFIGHPLVDRVAAWRKDHPEATRQRDPDLVLLLPGSRISEIERIFPVMLDVVPIVAAARPSTRFQVFAADGPILDRLSSLIAAHPASSTLGERVSVNTGSTFDAMARCAAGLVASGTATVECAFFGLPIAIVYRVSPFTYRVARRLVRVPHIGMVNLLAGETVAREFVQHEAQPEPLATELIRLLDDAEARETIRRRMADVADSLGDRGCADRGAREILDLLG